MIRYGEFDRHRLTGRLPGERLDAAAETLLDPLEHEAVGCGEAQASRLVRASKRPDPGSELLGRQLSLESDQTCGPRGGMRSGMHGNGLWMTEGFGVPQLMCDWPGRGHCSRAFRGYPQTGKPRSGAAGATRVGVEVATRVAGSIVPLRRSR